MASIELWNHCENPYPFVPAEVLERRPRCGPACPIATATRDRGAAVRRDLRRIPPVRRNRPAHRHQRAPFRASTTYGRPARSSPASSRDITQKVRILSLGTLITVRPDPVRVAEEYATIDVLSTGRLEIGFVKSGATEMVSGDANPMRIREREWEAIDLIEKTLTTP